MRTDRSGTLSLVSRAARESRKLLRRNLTPRGILAASRNPVSEKRNYARIFCRDASICALGMVVSGDPELAEMAGVGLLSLAQRQADNGQMPNFIDPDTGETDFWYVGCIDATLWWLVAVDHCDALWPRSGLGKELRGRIDSALRWLRCQEHPEHFLLQQNEASDWADIMPRSGYVLGTNVLWHHVKRRYALPQVEETREYGNRLFLPGPNGGTFPPRLRRLTRYMGNGTRGSETRELYASFVNFSFHGGEGDVFGNLLAVLFGFADGERSHRILSALSREKVDVPFPVRAVCDPIRRGDPLWRPYMDRHRLNTAFRYHNGGAWPFLGGFWVAALARTGRGGEALSALERLAHMNERNGWAFREWFHGRTGTPGGMTGQSWNAALFLFARHALEAKRL
ncbi:MAG TPA: glycoside hydrolase 100 family protein [Candidatus Deferrimicrobiaceae bacterium]